APDEREAAGLIDGCDAEDGRGQDGDVAVVEAARARVRAGRVGGRRRQGGPRDPRPPAVHRVGNGGDRGLVEIEQRVQAAQPTRLRGQPADRLRLTGERV